MSEQIKKTFKVKYRIFDKFMFTEVSDESVTNHDEAQRYVAKNFAILSVEEVVGNTNQSDKSKSNKSKDASDILEDLRDSINDLFGDLFKKGK